MFFMRNLLVCMVLVVVCSCKVHEIKPHQPANLNSIENCPIEGYCNLEVLKQRHLQLKKDNIGMLYPEISIGNGVVLKFSYTKNAEENVSDGSYIEEIFLELDKSKLEYTSKTLKSENIIFSRLCFCKGESGYFKVNNGELNLSRISKNTYQIHLKIQVPEVPHVLTEINEIFQLP